MAADTKPAVAFLDPTGEVRDRASGLAPRQVELSGKVMGVVDDGMPHCDSLLKSIADEMEARYELQSVVNVVKPSFSAPLPDRTFRDIAAQVDFVLVGVGV